MKNQNLIEFGTSSCGIREHVENIRKWAHRWLRLGWLQVWETFNFRPSHVHTSAESAPCKAPISPLLGPAWPSAASHLPLAFTYLRTFPIWWRRYVQIMFPTLDANLQASCYFVYFGTWFLRSLLRFFLLCFSSLTSEGGDWHYGWWLTYGDIVRVATIQAQQLWYLSTCSTAASPQFLSTRASARASSKSSASNSAGPACQQLFTYPNGDLTLLFNATYAQWTFIHIHTCHPADSKVPYMPSIHAILCPTGVSHGDESMEGGTWCGMPQDSQDPTQLRPCDRLLRKWWSWHIVTISIYHGSKFAQQSGL